MLSENYGGVVPDTIEELTKLPGVGRKTANLLLGDLYGVPGSVVCDTHCIRICGRLGLSEGKDPEKVERQLRQILPPEESSDFCHRMVLHRMAEDPFCAAFSEYSTVKKPSHCVSLQKLITASSFHIP